MVWHLTGYVRCSSKEISEITNISSFLSIFIYLGVLKSSRFDQKDLFQKIYLVQFAENGKSRDQIFPPGFDPEATQAAFISFFLYFSFKSNSAERFLV